MPDHPVINREELEDAAGSSETASEDPRGQTAYAGRLDRLELVSLTLVTLQFLFHNIALMLFLLGSCNYT